jgi:glutamate-5-semialdehyde dehydrogenase
MSNTQFSEYINNVCINAKKSSRILANLSSNERNRMLLDIAAGIRKRSDFIIQENKKDIAAADAVETPPAMRDRLLLNEARIEGMALSVEDIARFEDPIGKIESMSVRPSGIRVGQMRVPLGVVAVIFESRPNVTTDIAALAIKSGNAAILRGGKEAIYSNLAIYSVIRDVLAGTSCPEAVTLIEKTEHEVVSLLLKMNKYIDVVIPRGGSKLINMVTGESSIPVLKHDKGVCHTFIDASASLKMASEISVNAKVQRPGVCNSMETLLVHKYFSEKVKLLEALMDKGVEIRGCAETVKLIPGRIVKATDEDWDTEYLDLILSVKIVGSLDEAVSHIHRYGSGHSEAIVTSDYSNSQRFLREVDSAAVFVNASTRFHDGGEFGLGAEVGISTQKLHARGAMGVTGLTCLKYVVYGDGQIRH